MTLYQRSLPLLVRKIPPYIERFYALSVCLCICLSVMYVCQFRLRVSFEGIRSNWSKTNFRRNAVKWWFLYVIWCVESIGERILSIRLLVLEISSSKVDFFANTFTWILNGLGDRDGSWLFVFSYVFWWVKFNGEEILNLGPSLREIYGVNCKEFV